MTRFRVAILDEPPFAWPAGGQTARGHDAELLSLAFDGVAELDFMVAAFDELIPGLQANSWDITTAMFVTTDRATQVAFSRPVWRCGDGVAVLAEHSGRGHTFAEIARDPSYRLGVVEGQIQPVSAVRAGVRHGQLVWFRDQVAATRAVANGEVDGAVSTDLGNRALVARSFPGLVVVPIRGGSTPTLGAYAVRRTDTALLARLNELLAIAQASERYTRIRQTHGFGPEHGPR